MTSGRTSSLVRIQTLLAFLTVYVCWGACFLLVQRSVATIPPMLTTSLRFLFASVLMFGLVRLGGKFQFTRVDVKDAAVQALMLLVIGNGVTACVAEKIPSGYTGMLWATVPLWGVLLQMVWPGMSRPSARVILSALIGFGGLSLLVEPWKVKADISQLVPTFVVLLGTLGWATGLFLGKSAKGKAEPMVATALQMLLGGAMLLVLSFGRGELTGFHFAQVTRSSWMALSALVFVGGILPLSAYVWLTRRVTPTQLFTYAYVNPIVGILIGTVFAGEALSPNLTVGGAIILFGVALSMTDKKAPEVLRAPESPVLAPAAGTAAIG